MDWQTIQDALKTWVQDQLAIPVAWENEAQLWKVKAYAQLRVGASGARGVDDTSWAQDIMLPAGTDNVPTIAGNREFTLSVRVTTRDQRPAGAARFHLEKLRTSIHKPSVKAAFKAANIAWQNTSDLQPLDDVENGRVESIANLDIRFNASAEETDTNEAGSFVDVFRATAVLRDPSGVDVGWVDEDFGNV